MKWKKTLLHLPPPLWDLTDGQWSVFWSLEFWSFQDVEVNHSALLLLLGIPRSCGGSDLFSVVLDDSVRKEAQESRG